MKKKNFLDSIPKYYNLIGVIVITIGFILILVPTFPYIWSLVNPSTTENEISALSKEISLHEEKVVKEEEIVEDTNELNLPPINTDLPIDPYIEIKEIGVYSPITAGEDYVTALNKGTWIVPNFGDPINSDKPIILAAHRFGYSSWGKETRDTISFYNLPKTEEGDVITIIWDQREFQYQIYDSEENTYITDYNADLILYTCKFFNSPIRIFRYAKAVN